MKMSFALTFPKRLKGLLYTEPNDSVLLIVPCRSIHTFGMKYAIDVAFINQAGLVVRSIRDVFPNSKEKCRDACAVLERFARPDDSWFREGDFISVACGQKFIQPDVPGFLEEDLDVAKEIDGFKTMESRTL